MQREAVVVGHRAEGSVKGTLEEKGDMKTKMSGVVLIVCYLITCM